MKKIPCEIWVRRTGYYRPLSEWNPGKQEEYKMLKKYEIENNDVISKILSRAVIVSRGQHKTAHVGHRLCGACQLVKAQIMDGYQGMYIGFDEIDDLRMFANEIGLEGELSLPLEVEVGE